LYWLGISSLKAEIKISTFARVVP
jgi:hypothetical protein